jgi:uncharacterized membrane protein YccC
MRRAQALRDDVLTERPRVHSPQVWLRETVDQLLGADPGLTQLRLALQAVLGIGAGLGLAYVFVRVTGALQLPPGSAPAPVLSAADRAMLLVSMLIAGMVAMQTTFVVRESRLAGQVVLSLLLPVPMVTSVVLGLLAGPYRVPSLIYMVVVMALGVYLRRFGQRGFAAGNVVFFGAFFGYFLHTQLAVRDAGWIAADLWVGVLASLLVRVAFFRPDPQAALARMRRSQRARARRLLALVATVLTETDDRRIRAVSERIGRQLIRLNETSLMIDAQLPETRPQTAAAEAQRNFDAELALSNCARFAVALAEKPVAATVRRSAAAALSALLDDDGPAVSRAIAAVRASCTPERPCAVSSTDDHPAVLTSRLASSVEQYAAARHRLDEPVGPEEIARAGSGDFTPAVELVNGWLPGSTTVSTEASTMPRPALLDRATMPRYLRTTIQIAVAGTLAVVAGYLVSPQRVYWALLTVFVCFIAASNSGEQMRRGLLRAGGTAIGIVLGDLFVHLTGGHVWTSVLLVLAAMFLGIYLIRVNYMFMTIGITVMIAQLFVRLDELSWHLLGVRLAETTVGVAAVVITVLVIVPLRPQRVLATGLLLWFRSLRELLDAVLGRLEGEQRSLWPLVRAVDAAYDALAATAKSLRQVTFGRTSSELTEILAVSSAARQYARSLAALIPEMEATGPKPPAAGNRSLRIAGKQLRASLDAIERRLTTGENADYVRSASLYAVALDDLREHQSPMATVLDDLTRFDGAMARLATALQMPVSDHDTGPVGFRPLRSWRQCGWPGPMDLSAADRRPRLSPGAARGAAATRPGP